MTRRRLQQFCRAALRSRSILLGFVLLAAVMAVTLLAPLLTPYDPLDVRPGRRLLPPSRDHWFGTDDMGRDVFSRVVHGGRISLLVSAAVALLSTVLGSLFGLVAGYVDRLSRTIMSFMDGLMAFPPILLAIALMATLGPRMSNVILALSVVYMTRTVRVIRSVVLVARELSYVEAARASGGTLRRVLTHHIFPNCIAPLTVQASFVFASAILYEASLSFLGVGIPPYLPSWGNILSGGRLVMRVAPWVIWFPGLAIMVSVLALNLLGDGLRDILDPRLRGLSDH